uniref:Uncharacterized protein n=1 Tax=Arundo donax TaxID=35708 RepID=A0A0A8Z7P1_ARUDO
MPSLRLLTARRRPSSSPRHRPSTAKLLLLQPVQGCYEQARCRRRPFTQGH